MTVDQSVCQHIHTDHRGSTKTMVRTWCKDCGKYVDAIPRDMANEINQAVQDAGEALGLDDIETLRKVVQRESISTAEAVRAGQIFVGPLGRPRYLP